MDKCVILSKLGHFKNSELNTQSCRVFCGLSEKHEIIEIRSLTLNLWPFKATFPSHTHLYRATPTCIAQSPHSMGRKTRNHGPPLNTVGPTKTAEQITLVGYQYRRNTILYEGGSGCSHVTSHHVRYVCLAFSNLPFKLLTSEINSISLHQDCAGIV